MNNEKPKLRITPRGEKVLTTGMIIAGGAMAAGGIMGLESMKGGSESIPQNAEISPTIFSVVLNENANLRFDPYVADEEVNNLVLPDNINPASIEIVGEGRTYVLPDTNNGTWYGMSTDAVRDAFGGQLAEEVVDHIRSDKDGIVWVNEQGVADVRHLTDVDENATAETGTDNVTDAPTIPSPVQRSSEVDIQLPTLDAPKTR